MYNTAQGRHNCKVTLFQYLIAGGMMDFFNHKSIIETHKKEADSSNLTPFKKRRSNDTASLERKFTGSESKCQA